MSEAQGQVEQIQGWLAGYREDVARVRAAMLSEAPSPRACYTLAGALNYQLRKMDLTPDWTPEIGMVDDVMVLRTGASVFKINNLLELPADVAQTIDALAAEDEVVKAVLGEEQHEALFSHIRELIERRIHGRTAEEIVDDAAVQKAFFKELDDYLEAYAVPTLGEPEALLSKVRSYIGAKLR